ncbi:hypothetical protein BKA61DRAFT_669022 [Leptodontidium sp. MPI-SDFR-AT-0119]|nr:hypothetical protein BKA61DRAFT_669022 [Leptodontidium sp. MPI-SDFR-AT-0119]
MASTEPSNTAPDPTAVTIIQPSSSETPKASASASAADGKSELSKSPESGEGSSTTPEARGTKNKAAALESTVSKKQKTFRECAKLVQALDTKVAQMNAEHKANIDKLKLDLETMEDKQIDELDRCKLIARLPDVFLKIPSMSEDADPSYESLIDSFVEETKNIGPPFVVLDVWWPSCENLGNRAATWLGLSHDEPLQNYPRGKV